MNKIVSSIFGSPKNKSKEFYSYYYKTLATLSTSNPSMLSTLSTLSKHPSSHPITYLNPHEFEDSMRIKRIQIDIKQNIIKDFAMTYEFKCNNSKCEQYNKVISVNIPMSEYSEDKFPICEKCKEKCIRQFSGVGIKTFGDGYKS